MLNFCLYFALHINVGDRGMDEGFCSMEEMPESLHNVVKDVVSFLEDKQTRRVGIWGTMGTGKTTIMQNLKNHKDIVKMFDIVIWVTLPKEWSIKKLQNAILQQLEMIVQSNVSVKETAQRIFEMLRGKKYLILLDEVCGFVDLHKIMKIQDNQESKVVSASRFRDICKAMGADELIKVKPLSDHEAFSLFEEKVGQSIHFPRIREVAKDVIKECGGLPLVIDKAAREFKKKGKNVSLWRDGLRHLQKWEAECIHEAISFMKSCYDKVDDDKKKAFLYCVLFPEEYDVYIDYLLECWRAEGFIRSRDQGHQILNTLINLSLLEKSEKRAYYVKLSKMVRGLAIMISSQTTDSRFLLKPHHGLKEPPQGQEWKQASRISLIDNHLVSLPENLDCGNLLTLFLQGNKELLSIPKLFFSSMHCLQVLDLHGIGISSLPSSVSDLISLKALYLNSCINLEELPSSIKGLHYLEVLDIRGTKLYLFQMKVPLWLKCLRISVFNLCAQTTTRRELDSISALVSLEEFCVDDDCPKQGWDEVAKNLILEVAALQNLTSFRFYFPTVNTLKLFLTKSPAWKRTSAFTFQFSVGLQKPTYSELPEYFNAPSYNHLKLANTNASDFVILELLMRTHVLSLIDHQGVSTLSDFSIENMDTLLACTVEGCKEIETIINGDGTERGTALQCLEYMCIHNLPKLEIIWKGPVLAGSLHQLKILILTKCPKLKNIFSNGMIQQLHHLQQLTVQECHEIEEIVTESENHGLDPGSLPRLKSLVLLDLPQLRSIWVDDSLEWPSLQTIRIFRCNKLKRLPFGRANAARLRSIEGEESWWETLVWKDDAIKERLQSICTRSVSL